jgi:hypothetical protein
MFQLCVTPERRQKTRRIMEALRGCFPEHQLCLGKPRPDKPFAVWGHRWTGAQIVPRAWKAGAPFYFIDNGYHVPANGSSHGYYSVTYRSFGPMFLDEPDMSRLPVVMKDWRPPRDDPDGVVLLCMPGEWFGKMFGWNMSHWSEAVIAEVGKHTSRPIVVRDKDSSIPFEYDLCRAAVVITHSSKAAVRAILDGVPCIVESLNPAAPVSGTSLSQIEDPPMPDRARWWASLMCQQFSLDEMRRGEARHWLQVAREQGERDMRPGLPVYSTLLDVPAQPIVIDDEPQTSVPEAVVLNLLPGQRLFVNGVEIDLWPEKGSKPTVRAAGRRDRNGTISYRA